MTGIYKIINLLNNKIYIGSAVDFKNRTSTHLYYLNNNKHPNKILQNSFNKYGKENFKFTLIKNCKKENLLKIEQYYISKLNPEYNICKIAGSKLGYKTPEEVKQKISKSNLGKTVSTEVKIKISNSLKGRKNKPCSEEKRNKISESNKKVFRDKEELKIKLDKARQLSVIKRRKIIDQIDINGNIIKTYMSLDDAANDLNINPKRISSVVTGSRKHYKKMIFKYH